jgi:hypothetical protein
MSESDLPRILWPLLYKCLQDLYQVTLDFSKKHQDVEKFIKPVVDETPEINFFVSKKNIRFKDIGEIREFCNKVEAMCMNSANFIPSGSEKISYFNLMKKVYDDHFSSLFETYSMYGLKEVIVLLKYIENLSYMENKERFMCHVHLFCRKNEKLTPFTQNARIWWDANIFSWCYLMYLESSLFASCSNELSAIVQTAKKITDKMQNDNQNLPPLEKELVYLVNNFVQKTKMNITSNTILEENNIINLNKILGNFLLAVNMAVNFTKELLFGHLIKLDNAMDYNKLAEFWSIIFQQRIEKISEDASKKKENADKKLDEFTYQSLQYKKELDEKIDSISKDAVKIVKDILDKIANEIKNEKNQQDLKSYEKKTPSNNGKKENDNSIDMIVRKFYDAHREMLDKKFPGSSECMLEVLVNAFQEFQTSQNNSQGLLAKFGKIMMNNVSSYNVSSYNNVYRNFFENLLDCIDKKQNHFIDYQKDLILLLEKFSSLALVIKEIEKSKELQPEFDEKINILKGIASNESLIANKLFVDLFKMFICSSILVFRSYLKL